LSSPNTCQAAFGNFTRSVPRFEDELHSCNGGAGAYVLAIGAVVKLLHGITWPFPPPLQLCSLSSNRGTLFTRASFHLCYLQRIEQRQNDTSVHTVCISEHSHTHAYIINVFALKTFGRYKKKLHKFHFYSENNQ